MSEELTPTEKKEQKTKVVYRGGAADAVYGLGLLGAWVFYISHAASFADVVIGVFKGIFWPGFMVYQLLAFLATK